MAFTPSSLMTSAMNNPQAAVVGLAAGFAIGFYIARSKYRNSMGMGGGF